MRVAVAVLVAILLFLQFELWFGERGMRRVWRLEGQIEAQQAKNAAARQRNDALKAEVQDLKSGFEAMEERARNELGMIREGETFFQVIEEPVAEPPSPP
jgi:cell division protein FtsB